MKNVIFGILLLLIIIMKMKTTKRGNKTPEGQVMKMRAIAHN